MPTDQCPTLVVVDVEALAACAERDGCECETCDVVRSLARSADFNHRGRSTMGEITTLARALVALAALIVTTQIVIVIAHL